MAASTVVSRLQRDARETLARSSIWVFRALLAGVRVHIALVRPIVLLGVIRIGLTVRLDIRAVLGCMTFYRMRSIISRRTRLGPVTTAGHDRPTY